jgi:hypothetical protein
MFADLFHRMHSREHDYKEEKGQKIYSFGYRLFAVPVRLNGLQDQILCLLRDIDFAVGEPLEKDNRS